MNIHVTAYPDMPQNSADKDGNYIVKAELDLLFTKQKYEQIQRE